MAAHLSDVVKIVDILDHTEGSADRNSSGIDMSGFDSVMIVVKFGDIAAGATTSIKAQQSSDDGSSDAYADLAGTKQSVAATDDNKIFYIDMRRVDEKWIRLVVDKDTSNNTEEMAWAMLYDRGNAPTTHGATVSGETFVGITEGTA